MSEDYCEGDTADDENVSNDIINSVSQNCKGSADDNEKKRFVSYIVSFAFAGLLYDLARLFCFFTFQSTLWT